MRWPGPQETIEPRVSIRGRSPDRPSMLSLSLPVGMWMRHGFSQLAGQNTSPGRTARSPTNRGAAARGRFHQSTSIGSKATAPANSPRCGWAAVSATCCALMCFMVIRPAGRSPTSSTSCVRSPPMVAPSIASGRKLDRHHRQAQVAEAAMIVGGGERTPDQERRDGAGGDDQPDPWPAVRVRPRRGGGKQSRQERSAEPERPNPATLILPARGCGRCGARIRRWRGRSGASGAGSAAARP